WVIGLLSCDDRTNRVPGRNSSFLKLRELLPKKLALLKTDPLDPKFPRGGIHGTSSALSAQKVLRDPFFQAYPVDKLFLSLANLPHKVYTFRFQRKDRLPGNSQYRGLAQTKGSLPFESGRSLDRQFAKKRYDFG